MLPPEVAVTVTRYIPVPAVVLPTVALNGTVIVAPAARLALVAIVKGSVADPGVSMKAKLTVVESEMVPAKLLMLFIAKNVPAGTSGFSLWTTIWLPTAFIEKSAMPTFTVTVAERLPVLPVPVTVTVYAPEAVPVGTLTVRVEVEPAVTDDGVSVAVGPAGETVAARLTIPAKLAMLLTLIVEDTDVPCAVVKLDGLAETLKSGTVT